MWETISVERISRAFYDVRGPACAWGEKSVKPWGRRGGPWGGADDKRAYHHGNLKEALVEAGTPLTSFGPGLGVRWWRLAALRSARSGLAACPRIV